MRMADLEKLDLGVAMSRGAGDRVENVLQFRFQIENLGLRLALVGSADGY